LVCGVGLALFFASSLSQSGAPPPGWTGKTVDVSPPDSAPFSATNIILPPEGYVEDRVVCTAKGLGFAKVSGKVLGVKKNEHLLALQRCHEIDYLYIWGCIGCSSAVWQNLKLDTISGKDPKHGYSFRLVATDTFEDLVGLQHMKGPLAGGFGVQHTINMTSFTGAEHITDINLNKDGTR
jgi:hypothetical protein